MYTHTLSLSLSVYMLFLLLTIWFIDQGVSMIIRSTVVFISNDRHTHTHTQCGNSDNYRAGGYTSPPLSITTSNAWPYQPPLRQHKHVLTTVSLSLYLSKQWEVTHPFVCLHSTMFN